MKKILVVFVVLLIVCASINVFTMSNKTSEGITIGVLAPLSGEFGRVGQESYKGIQLATKEYNATNPPLPVVLNVKDGKAQTQESLSALQQMIFSGINGLILVGEPQKMVAAPIANKEKIPTIVTLAGDYSTDTLTSDRYLFFNFLSATIAGQKLGMYAKKIGLQKVAVLSMLNPRSQQWTDGFKKGYGNPLVIYETYDNQNRDLRTQVVKVLSKHPDGIFITGYGLPCYMLINLLKEQDYAGVLMADDYITDPAVQQFADAQNIIFAQVNNVTAQENARYKQFVDAYMNEFHEKPSLFSQYGYDSMRLILEGIKRSKGSSSEQIYAGLKSIQSFDTFSGKLEVLQDGSWGLETVLFKAKEDGSAVLIEK